MKTEESGNSLPLLDYPQRARVECDGGCGFSKEMSIDPGSKKWITRFSALANIAHDRDYGDCTRKALTFHVRAAGLLKHA